MKKYLYVISVLLFSMCFFGCGAGNVGDANYMQAQQSEDKSDTNTSSAVEIFDKQAGIDNITQYLISMDIIDEKTKTNVAYNVIGAKNGARYTATVADSRFNLELYEFDTDDLSSTAQNTISSVKNNGSFDILNLTVNAIISDNGKYIMIYEDNSTSEENIAKKNSIIEQFKTWP